MQLHAMVLYLYPIALTYENQFHQQNPKRKKIEEEKASNPRLWNNSICTK
jgi:hypothetical protein